MNKNNNTTVFCGFHECVAPIKYAFKMFWAETKRKHYTTATTKSTTTTTTTIWNCSVFLCNSWRAYFSFCVRWTYDIIGSHLYSLYSSLVKNSTVKKNNTIADIHCLSEMNVLCPRVLLCWACSNFADYDKDPNCLMCNIFQLKCNLIKIYFFTLFLVSR